jgi:hypothetical protein
MTIYTFNCRTSILTLSCQFLVATLTGCVVGFLKPHFLSFSFFLVAINTLLRLLPFLLLTLCVKVEVCFVFPLSPPLLFFFSLLYLSL